jgi:endonuclease/exonuclease/phosphatase family metal-dependent hydrolase
MSSGSLHQEDELQAIRVLTFNILSADYADWERRREVVRTGLLAIRPDIVALQETTPGQGPDQALELLGPGYHVIEHPTHSEDQVGAVLASRWPFSVAHEIDLAVAPRVPSALAVVAELELPEPFGLTVVVHHGAAYQFGYAKERELQAVTCARFVKQLIARRDAHVLVLGDFNDDSDSASVRLWTGRQSLEGFSVAYVDAWEPLDSQLADVSQATNLTGNGAGRERL